MPSSVWSGHLTFGLISMPVRLFSGARSSGISFHMLHRPDKQRVKQQYICPVENVVVDRSEIVKGYEFRKDEYIVIEPDEIKKIEPQTAKTMEILEFVKSDEGDPDKYKDNLQENLKKLIETKLEGGEVAAVEKPKKLAPVVDLMAALKQSLAQMEGKKKPAARAKDEESVAAAASGKSRRRR